MKHSFKLCKPNFVLVDPMCKFTTSKLNALKNKKICVIGYGSQGSAQSMNLRDGNYDVILGLRKDGKSYQSALRDKWIPNETLFSIDEAVYRSNIIGNLLSDHAQVKTWSMVKANLKPQDTLWFSHGFGIVYSNLTQIIPPTNVATILIAPKGNGNSLRNKFLQKSGVACSYAFHNAFHNSPHQSEELFNLTMELGHAIGALNMFRTTFEKEVTSDLTGERCALIGALQGLLKAQFDVLLKNGHSRTEAYHETVEELTRYLLPIIDTHGMDHLLRNCSTTAQIGALKWAPIFEAALKPIIQDCYNSVKNGTEAKEVLDFMDKDPDYKQLNASINKVANQDIWDTGMYMREFRDDKIVPRNH